MSVPDSDRLPSGTISRPPLLPHDTERQVPYRTAAPRPIGPGPCGLCTQRRLVAPGAASVRERLALHGDEPPPVALRAQGELQHAVGVVVADLAFCDEL